MSQFNHPTDATDRRWFVYRAWDEFGLLLYIGCTKQLETRWKQHNTKPRAAWTQYAQTFHASGPYTKPTARAIEEAAVEAERPYFNALAEHTANQRQRFWLHDRLLRELREVRTHSAVETFRLGCERIQSQVDTTFPNMDGDWRHAHYLDAIHDLRTLKLVPA